MKYYTQTFSTDKKLCAINEIAYMLLHNLIKPIRVVGYIISSNNKLECEIKNVDDSLISNEIEDKYAIYVPADIIFLTKEDAEKEFKHRIAELLFESNVSSYDNLNDLICILNSNQDITFNAGFVDHAKNMKELLNIIISRDERSSKSKKFGFLVKDNDKETVITGLIKHILVENSVCVSEVEVIIDDKDNLSTDIIEIVEDNTNVAFGVYLNKKSKGIIEPVKLIIEDDIHIEVTFIEK